MEIVAYSLIMLLLIVISGFVTRALLWAIPLPLIQILLGALWASISNYKFTLTPDFFFILFLPPLLFWDGWQVSKTGLRQNKIYVLSLALGLVIFTVVGLGYGIHWLIPSMPLAVAFALAAVLSPTDPVAVSAIAARIPIPQRALHILEGESLLNDASGLVCFKFAVAAVVVGTFSFSQALITFVWVALGGLLVGVSVTVVTEGLKSWLVKRLGEELGTQILISILIPFGAYLLAEQWSCSGILAVVAAGVTMSFIENSGRAQAITRLRRRAVWDAIKFSLNGILFVLLGEQLPELFQRAELAVHEAGHHNVLWLLMAIVVITLMLVLLRFMWGWLVIRVTWLADKTVQASRTINWRILSMMSVAGVRGAVTLAGVLTLPYLLPDGRLFPTRDLAIFIAAGVIILSLVLASAVIPWLLTSQALPIELPIREHELKLASRAAVQAAITALEKAQTKKPARIYTDEAYLQVIERVLTDYYHNQTYLQPVSAEEQNRQQRLIQLEKQLRHLALKAERDEVYRLARQRQISDDTMQQLIHALDLMEVQLS